MTTLQKLYELTSKLEEWIILIYAVAVFLPITYAWIVLIVGIVVFILRAGLETALLNKNDAGASWWNAFKSTSAVASLTGAPLLMPLLVYTAVVFATGLVNGGVKEGFSSIETLRTFLLYFLAYHSFRRSEVLIRKAVVVLLSFGGVAGIWGTIQQVFHFHPFEKFQWLQGSGFMGNPMAYAGQMEVTGCLAAALLLSGGFKTAFKGNWILFSLITLCNLAGVLFAGERSGWLGALAGLLSISALLPLWLFGSIILAGIVCGAVAWFAVPVVQTRIVPLLTNPQGDVGVSARLIVWQKAIEVWQQFPVFGVGVRNFPKLDIPEAIVPGESTYLVHAHNNFLHILATMGVIGLIAFGYLELAMLWLAFKTWRAKGVAGADSGEKLFQRAIGLGALGGIVSLMVAGFFEYNFGTGHVRLMHWFVLAMLISSNAKRESVSGS